MAPLKPITLDDARSAGLFHPNCTHNITTAMTFESEIVRAKYAGDLERKVQAALDEGESFWDTIPLRGRASLWQYTDREINSLVNQHLYTGREVDKEILDMIKYLDQAMEEASLPEDMILYRGVSPKIWEIMKADPGYITPGDEVTPKGFLSSTYDRASAWKYASEKASKDDEIAMIEILAPRGTKAMAIEKHSQSPDDREILINQGTSFKVIEARKDGNVMRLVWEVM